MTAEETKEFRDNYNILYNDFQELGQGLEDYQQKAKGTKEDLRRLKNSTVYFQDIVETIVYEYAYKYPECKCVNSNGGILISYTITSLNRGDYIDDKTAKMLRKADYYGNANTDHINNIRTSDFLDIKATYEELINYMTEFLKLFPHPNSERERAQRERTEKQQNQAEKETQTAQNNADINRDSNTKSYQKRFWWIVVILIVVIIIIAYMYITTGNGTEHEMENDQIDITSDQNNENTTQIEDDINQSETEPAEEEIKDIEETDENINQEKEEKHYTVGETWTVEGKWEFAIDEVTASPFPYDINNPYNPWGEHDPDDLSQTIIISYHYTNLGLDRGLIMSLSESQIVDGNGVYAEQMVFVNEDLTSPAEVAMGGTWNAQQDFHILTDAKNATITYSYDGATAIFDLTW